MLVMIGVRADGRRSWSRSPTGTRESAESWADLLRSCRRRGMTAPVLAVGDGALGFWKAVREVPGHRRAAVLVSQAGQCSCLPAKVGSSGGDRGDGEIYNAGDIDHAQVAIKAFEVDYGAKYPKAVAKIVDDADVLLGSIKYPAEHWVHLHYQPDRINVCHGTFEDQGDQRGAGFTRRRNGHGLQADRRRAKPAGEPSTHRTWSLWSGPARSSTKANCSSDPPTSPRRRTRHRPNQLERRSPETSRSTGIDNSSLHVQSDGDQPPRAASETS